MQGDELLVGQVWRRSQVDLLGRQGLAALEGGGIQGRPAVEVGADVGKGRRQRLAHLGTGVLGGHDPADLHQPKERDTVPVLGRLDAKLIQTAGQDLLGVEDKRGQLAALPLQQRALEHLLDAPRHRARPVAQHVQKGLVLAVDIREKVLGTLGQVQDRAQVDDFSGSRLDAGELARQQLQVAQVMVFGPQDGCSVLANGASANRL